MTQNKRFKLAFEDFDGWAICDTTGEYSDDEDYIDWLSGQKAVDVLNKLDSENQKLKKENEQLQQQKDKWKQQCIDFKEMLDDMDIAYLCDEWIYEELKGDV